MTLPQRFQDWDFRYADDGGSDSSTSTDTAPPSVQGQPVTPTESDAYGSGIDSATMQKVSPGQSAQSDNQTLSPAGQQALVQTPSSNSNSSSTNTNSNSNSNSNKNNQGGSFSPSGILTGLAETAAGVGGDALLGVGDFLSGGSMTVPAAAGAAISTGYAAQGLQKMLQSASIKHAEGLAGSNDQLYMDPIFTGDNNTENMDGEQESGILASFRRISSEDDFYGQANPDISGTSSAEQGTIGLGGSQTQTGNPGLTGQDQKDMNIMTYSSWGSRDYLNTIKQSSDSDDYKSGFEHGQSGREPDESMLNLSDDYFHGFQDGKVYKQHALVSAPAKLIDIKPGSNELPRINHHDPRAASVQICSECSSMRTAHCGMPGCADEEGNELGVGNRTLTEDFLNHFGSAGCRCCNGSGLVCGDCGGSLVTAAKDADGDDEASEPKDEKEDEDDGE